MKEELYTVSDVCEMLKKGRYFIYDLVKDGKLTAYHVGRSLRFNKEDIQKYLEKNRTA